MIKVLFVCLGNICRSPMAEAIFRDKIKSSNIKEKIEVDSAGTADWHTGKAPHEGTRRILEQRNISYEGMVARPFVQEDFQSYDYILVMDDQNLHDVQKIAAKTKYEAYVGKLMHLIESPKETNVPDPYYTGDFEYTYELVDEACDALLHKIINENNI